MSRSDKDDLHWFHSNLSRDEAEQLMRKESRENGTFFIRECNSALGDFVLTLLHEGEVCHYQIRRHGGDAFFSIDDKVKILHGLESLVEFYQQAANGLPTKLTSFVKGYPPPNDTRRHGSTNLLHRATKENNQTIVSELLKCGYRNVDAKNQDGQTAIHLAAMYSDESILKLLLDAGVNVNCMDTAGYMPLHYACRNRAASFIRILIEANANIQGRNIKNGQVPLHVAAEYGNLAAVEVLLSYHAPLLPRTNSGEFPIDLANEKDKQDVVQYLNSYKIPPANTLKCHWYHGTLKREEAIEALNKFAEKIKQPSMPVEDVSNEDTTQNNDFNESNDVDTSGFFLVRYSDRVKGGSSGYVLTMLCNEQVKHFIISQSSSYLYIDEGPYLPSLEHLVQHFMRFNDGLPVNLKFAVPPEPKPPQPLLSTIPRNRNKKNMQNKIESAREFEENISKHEEALDDQKAAKKSQSGTSKKKNKDQNSVFSTLRKLKYKVTSSYEEKQNLVKQDHQTQRKNIQDLFPCKDLSFATNFSNLQLGVDSDEKVTDSFSAAPLPSSAEIDEVYKVPKNNTAIYPHDPSSLALEIENKSETEADYFTKSDVIIEEERLLKDTSKINPESSAAPNLNLSGYIPTVDVRVFLDQNETRHGDFSNEISAAELRECSINPERFDSFISSISTESEMLRYLNRQTSEASDVQNNDADAISCAGTAPIPKISCFIPAECLELGTVIGEGEFGSVYSGYLMPWQNSAGGNNMRCEVAIKTLRDEHCRTNKQEFLREASVMIRLKHHCIVQLIGISKGATLMMIQEMVSLGSMLTFIQTHKTEINPNQELKLWASQIACGMQYLEQHHFVHRDLAARNILLASIHQAKISDFGLSRALGSDNDFYEARQGGKWPVKWYAPESLKNGLFSHASDVWSFGVTLWEMFSLGEPPYGEMRGFEAVQLIEEGKRLPQPVLCSDLIYSIMQRCWQYSPNDRPTFRYLTEFFTKHPDYQNIMELVKTNHIS